MLPSSSSTSKGVDGHGSGREEGRGDGGGGRDDTGDSATSGQRELRSPSTSGGEAGSPPTEAAEAKIEKGFSRDSIKGWRKKLEGKLKLKRGSSKGKERRALADASSSPIDSMVRADTGDLPAGSGILSGIGSRPGSVLESMSAASDIGTEANRHSTPTGFVPSIRILPPMKSRSLTLGVSSTVLRTHTHTHARTLIRTRREPQAHMHAHTLTYTLTHTHSHAHSHTHSQACRPSHARTHTLTHTYMPTCTHTRRAGPPLACIITRAAPRPLPPPRGPASVRASSCIAWSE
eukprot:GHVU01048421.1.p1 GENE.GHVU01048421.1~~GHVU01048421.1.p1  ORF type:complete len:291 (-),score=7.38 GHVU01048421.1:150-1022(-)